MKRQKAYNVLMLGTNSHSLFKNLSTKSLAIYLSIFVVFIVGLVAMINNIWQVPQALSISQHVIIVMLVLFIWNVAFIRYYSMHSRFDLMLGYAYLVVFVLVCVQLAGLAFKINQIIEWTDVIEHILLGMMLFLLFPFIKTKDSLMKKLKKERLLLYLAVLIMVAVVGGIIANNVKHDTHSEVIELLNVVALLILLIAFYRIWQSRYLINYRLMSYIVLSLILLIMSEIVFAVSSSDFSSNRFYAGVFEALSFAVLAYGLLINVVEAFKYQARARLVLLTKNKELASIDKQKDEFVSFVSHQLRTPLTAIKWRIDFMKSDGKLNHAQKEDIDTIEKSNQKLIDLVNMFLNISRLNMKRYMPVIEKFRPFEIINIIIEENNQLIIQKNIDYKIKCHKDVHLEFDKTAFISILDNLITNAVKYSKQDGKIEIFCDINQDKIVIIVKDDGMGMPKAMQTSLFKPFVRLNNANKSGISGNGYGLYFIQKLITNLGGIITFESEENIGTIFKVQLPLELSLKSED